MTKEEKITMKDTRLPLAWAPSEEDGLPALKASMTTPVLVSYEGDGYGQPRVFIPYGGPRWSLVWVPKHGLKGEVLYIKTPGARQKIAPWGKRPRYVVQLDHVTGVPFATWALWGTGIPEDLGVPDPENPAFQPYLVRLWYTPHGVEKVSDCSPPKGGMPHWVRLWQV